MLRTVILLIGCVLAPAAEARLDGGILELPAGRLDQDIAIGLGGGTLRAAEPILVAGHLRFAGQTPTGLEMSVVARSLRGVDQPDWRQSQRIAGSRRVPRIDVQAAPGTPAERRAWGVRGTDDDWDDVSVQWDGILRIPEDGTDLATRSDDGSRVWLDRDGDGAVGAGEWGSNGWGQGQGATQRVVHAGLDMGCRRLRVQFEDGGGPNACTLLWRLPGRPWEAVPPEGFQAGAAVRVEGPVTFSGGASGPGTLILGDGVVLGLASWPERVLIAGQVRLDRPLAAAPLRFAAGGRLVLAGHAFSYVPAMGAGTIDLQEGHLRLPAGAHPVQLIGPGTVDVDGEADVLQADAGIAVASGSLRSPRRSVVRTRLTTPMTTVVAATAAAPGPGSLVAAIDLPAGIPADLGAAAWRADRQGRWFQSLHPGRLHPGRNVLHFDLSAAARLRPEGHAGSWSADAAADANHLGVLLYGSGAASAPILVETRFADAAPEPAATVRIEDLRLDPGPALTGRRWSLSFRPAPYPDNPYDPADLAADLMVELPDGSRRSFAAFHDEPVSSADRGDREVFRTAGSPCFRVRLRPTMAGIHRLTLRVAWRDGRSLERRLPDLVAVGPSWDGIVQVDAADPRFFSADGRFVWPAGCNLNSTYDTRCRSVMGTRLTPDRGSFTRESLLRRLAAGGGTGCEVWLSPWNLGLEWNPAWPGYRGAGRYHAGHAWAIDRLLATAEELGLRVNLSLFNHGMARDGSGTEDDWRFHPYAVAQGGWLEAPDGLFTDERAFVHQRNLFRYLAARYGDSPALLGWKLWAEVNLAHAPIADVRAWHIKASLAMRLADPWRHPITTHWCGDWRSPDRELAAQPGLGYLTIDAYKGDGTAIADLLCASTGDPLRGKGLAVLGKPVLVTEFGGGAGGTGRRRMLAEHAIGPWAGLVSGHAGAPMLWWFEWIDQQDGFGIYGAVNRFLAGEDLRGIEGRTIAPEVPRGLWCRAWSRPGRMLGYLLDGVWGTGGEEQDIGVGRIRLAGEVRPGPMTVEWWDADRGSLRERTDITHPGGTVELAAPAFRRHLAFKLLRRD